MITESALNAQVPKSHTIAIVQDDTIIHSGMMADSRKRWDDVSLDGNHGNYQYIGRTIDNRWNRITWMIK